MCWNKTSQQLKNKRWSTFSVLAVYPVVISDSHCPDTEARDEKHQECQEWCFVSTRYGDYLVLYTNQVRALTPRRVAGLGTAPALLTAQTLVAAGHDPVWVCLEWGADWSDTFWCGM